MSSSKLPALLGALALCASAMPAMAATACYNNGSGTPAIFSLTSAALPNLPTTATQKAFVVAGLFKPPLVTYTMPVAGSIIVKAGGPSTMLMTVGPFPDGSGGDIYTCRSSEATRIPTEWACVIVTVKDGSHLETTLFRSQASAAACQISVTPPPPA